MSNGLSASFTGGVSVSVPTYVADGLSGTFGVYTLTFSGGAPPSDGSVGLAFIQLAPALAMKWQNGGSQRLACFRGVTGGASISDDPFGGSLYTAKVTGWAFVHDTAE